MENSFNSRKIFINVVALLFIVAATLIIFTFFTNQGKEPMKRKEKITRKYVKTEPVHYQEALTEIIAFGRVASSEPLDVVAEVQGKITEVSIPLKEGQKFSKGAVLFEIDDTEAKLNLQAQKSTFLKDIAMILPDFKIDFSESYPAWQSYFTNLDTEKPLPDLPAITSTKQKTYLSIKNILTSYYNIKSKEANLKKYVVKAPFSGTIINVITQSGSVVNPGTKVLNVIRKNKLELKIPVETNDITWVKIGTKVIVTSEDGRQNWSAKVTRIGDVVNPNTQAIDVFVSIQPNKNKIYDGMYLRGTIPSGKLSDVLEVPRNITYNTDEVFVVEQDSLLKVKKIKIHKINAETMLISGLAKGVDLVVEPLVNAHNDMVAFKLSDAEKFRKEDMAKMKKDEKTGEEKEKKASK
jgi:multidrug efflux pump subunit AcrA (membrane-fusion protein)